MRRVVALGAVLLLVCACYTAGAVAWILLDARSFGAAVGAAMAALDSDGLAAGGAASVIISLDQVAPRQQAAVTE